MPAPTVTFTRRATRSHFLIPRLRPSSVLSIGTEGVRLHPACWLSSLRRKVRRPARLTQAQSISHIFLLVSECGGLRGNIKQYRGLRSFHSDASSISRRNRTEPLRVNFRQRTRVERGDPESQQVALALSLREILEGGSIVQDRVIVHKLNIAGLKLHRQVQRRVIREFVQQIQCLDLKRAKRPDLREAARGLDVLPLVDRRKRVSVPVEDRYGEK